MENALFPNLVSLVPYEFPIGQEMEDQEFVMGLYNADMLFGDMSVPTISTTSSYNTRQDDLIILINSFVLG